jgi:two-component system, LuxR family, response regulator FixJ
MSQRSLLIVEDEVDLQEVLSDLLSEVAEHIEVANNGAEALIKCQAYQFDAVLTDINMPIKSGLDFLTELRAMGQDTPVVFLSGYGDKAKVTQALRLGALDFLDKPFDDDLVTHTITRAIEFGQSLKYFDQVFAQMESKLNLPAEDIQKFKEAKKQIWMIRFESEFKKKAA